MSLNSSVYSLDFTRLILLADLYSARAQLHEKCKTSRHNYVHTLQVLQPCENKNSTIKKLTSLFGYVYGINLLVTDREISLWLKTLRVERGSRPPLFSGALCAKAKRQETDNFIVFDFSNLMKYA